MIKNMHKESGFEAIPRNTRKPGLLLRAGLGIGSLLTVAACENEAEQISSANRTEVINYSVNAITRTVDFWDHKYGDIGLDRNTIPNLTLEFDDDTSSALCDIFTPDEEGEIFFCNVDGEMVLNPTAIYRLIEKIGLDPENPTHLSAVTDVIAGHEFTHFLQKLRGDDQKVDVLTLELQADCAAGAQLAETGFAVNASIEELARSRELYEGIMLSLGDPRSDGKRTHGSPEERLGQFTIGYDTGIGSCFSVVLGR